MIFPIEINDYFIFWELNRWVYDISSKIFHSKFFFTQLATQMVGCYGIHSIGVSICKILEQPFSGFHLLWSLLLGNQEIKRPHQERGKVSFKVLIYFHGQPFNFFSGNEFFSGKTFFRIFRKWDEETTDSKNIL